MKRLLPLAVILLLAGFLRFYNISFLPNGLHWDEQDTGYQALSAFTTGKDYFGNPIPLFFHSFADFRTPVFIYSAVPSVAVFGLTPFAVRLPSAIFGLLSVLLIYLLSGLIFRNSKLVIRNFAGLSLAISPWHVQYGRQSVECNAMLTFILLGLVTFYKGLKNPGWLWVSGVGFGLAIASYSPAKMFVPLLVLSLAIIYRFQLLSLPRKPILVFVSCFLLLSLPIVIDGFFGQSGTRFHDVSIFTDPTLASEVDYQRQFSGAASGREVKIGQSPRFVDKVVYNKPQSIISTFTSNYLNVFSTQYLFTRGDQELRHSPNRNAIGQFHLPEVVTFIFGLFCLGTAKFINKKEAYLIAFWLLVGPIPSSLTRDGGAHAARTFLLLPAFILTISLGANYLFSKFRPLFLIYIVFLLFSGLNIFTYFFGTYRFESSRPFQWGFDKVINLALENSAKYSLVVVDLKNDSPLMAYLFTTRLPPAEFQTLLPLPVKTLTTGVSGNQFGNILLLSPGSRTWTNIMAEKNFPKDTLIISDASQPLIDTQTIHQDSLLYPDMSPFLYSFVSK
jgi:4-amino-4-deoxy-L-arabinose transferase-like glycosyltransferase